MYIIFQKIIYLKYAFSHGSNVQMIRLPSRFIKVYIKVSELSFGCQISEQVEKDRISTSFF